MPQHDKPLHDKAQHDKAQHDRHAHQPHGARESAAKALHDARDTAKDAATKAARQIDDNPLAIIVGGLAVGALVGAVLPRSAKEKQLLAPVGKRLGETARQALAAAKDAGRQQLDEQGLTPSAAKDRGREVIDGVVKALSSAGTAAAQSAKRTEQQV